MFTIRDYLIDLAFDIQSDDAAVAIVDRILSRCAVIQLPKPEIPPSDDYDEFPHAKCDALFRWDDGKYSVWTDGLISDDGPDGFDQFDGADSARRNAEFLLGKYSALLAAANHLKKLND